MIQSSPWKQNGHYSGNAINPGPLLPSKTRFLKHNALGRTFVESTRFSWRMPGEAFFFGGAKVCFWWFYCRFVQGSVDLFWTVYHHLDPFGKEQGENFCGKSASEKLEKAVATGVFSDGSVDASRKITSNLALGMLTCWYSTCLHLWHQVDWYTPKCGEKDQEIPPNARNMDVLGIV